MALIPLAEALKLILDDVAPLRADGDIESASLHRGLGRVLASDIHSTVDVPPADNSAMDGYALRLADWQGAALEISQRIPAGSVAVPLQPGTVARLFTGADIPPGADVVVMQENAELDGQQVSFQGELRRGQNIRPAGQDIAAGERVFAAGRRLSAQDLGVLASIGLAELQVYRRLRVAVFSTGDELVEPGNALSQGQIYNSNRYTLQGLIAAQGFEFVDFGIVPDDAALTGKTLSRAAEQCDCIITSGGVSVGEEDYVKAQVERLGELRLWKLAIKPGKPLAYGRVKGTPFFGLPGNPAAVYVTFNLVARPYLSQLQGGDASVPLTLLASANFRKTRASGRQEYLRARVMSASDGLQVEIFSNQSSGVLSALSWANALVVVPPDTVVEIGDKVQVLLLDSWG